jgi:predicted DNA-binding transcriptional regulator YafY
MATNKNATIRYQTLDRCFRNPGRKYFIDDLIKACNEALLDIAPDSSGVKRRQIFDDIKFMRDSRGFDAPIESIKDGKKAFYRYSNINFSINNQPLNEQEAQQLREAILTLSRFKGLPQFNWIEEMQLRLEHTFNLKNTCKAIEFEENPYLKGRDFISIIYHSIINSQTLDIHYKPFNIDEINTTVSPYYLKEFNNRWFLFGLNHSENQIMNMALDRIVNLNTSNKNYIINLNIDFEEYFEDVVGVSVPYNAEPEKVVLKIDTVLWPYIETKPIHGSQKIKEQNPDFTIIELLIIPNYEFESLIFSFFDKVEVIQPLHLRNQIKTKIQNLYKKY